MKLITLMIAVILLNAFAYMTIKLRPVIFNVKIFKPMLKNFKLSILPLFILLMNVAVNMILLLIGSKFNVHFMGAAVSVLFLIGFLIWLVFLPNSGYLITELNLTHRDNDEKEVPIWYDIVSILSFALSGIINTLANIVIIQYVFLVLFDPLKLDGSGYFVLFISGFVIIFFVVIGIYLGRAIRFNSWDILHPKSFFKKLKNHFIKKGVWKELILYLTFNTIFFNHVYIVWNTFLFYGFKLKINTLACFRLTSPYIFSSNNPPAKNRQWSAEPA
jgi:uncharacterized membrane protein